MGRINHPAWLAQKAAWDARETFEQILKQASGMSFEYPDGAQTMDTSNEYAAEAEDNENDGYFGSFNKHVIQKDIAHMQMQHTHGMDKIIQFVIDNRSVRGVDGNHKLPKDMIQSYIHARSVLPIVYICTLGACQQISADASQSVWADS